jgi:uncharacterized protein YcfL
MSKWALVLFALGLLVGCSDSETTKVKEGPEIVDSNNTETPGVEETDTTATEEEDVEETAIEVTEDEATINTAVFVYAEDVEVTDARDITQHLNLVIHMSDELTPGLATQHILNQTYDFLQQQDIEGANTLTIGIMQADMRIFQFTIDVKSFVPIDSEPMAACVLKAAQIDKMKPEVEEYGIVMGLW